MEGSFDLYNNWKNGFGFYMGYFRGKCFDSSYEEKNRKGSVMLSKHVL